MALSYHSRFRSTQNIEITLHAQNKEVSFLSFLAHGILLHVRVKSMFFDNSNLIISVGIQRLHENEKRWINFMCLLTRFILCSKEACCCSTLLY